MKRKLPPYGRQVAAVLNEPDKWPNYVGTSSDGRSLTFWVAIGEYAWEWVKAGGQRYLATVIPQDTDVDGYSWRFLAGHNPVILIGAGQVDDMQLRQAVGAFMRDGVVKTLYCSDKGVVGFIAEGASNVR